MTAIIRDPRFPADEDCILPYILRRNALERGEKTCVVFESGERWTHSEALKIARRVGGELILRTDMPWAMSHGYNAMPEVTARAWRNGWFHTGDAFGCDVDGNHFFVDRVKGAIRRRGENISSFEVESEVMTHPAILEVAAIGVPNELSEQDVLIALALKPGATLDEAELLSFLSERMSHFMVPRFIRQVAALPKTPTAKVEKHLLRAQGITDDTWDREAAGINVRRDRLVL